MAGFSKCTSYRANTGEEFVIISCLGDEGRHALTQLEEKYGPLEGHAAGIFRPCKLEQNVESVGRFFLFSLPSEIVSRVRLRHAHGWLAPGFGFTIKSSSLSDFRWFGGDAEDKQKCGNSMDSYPPPQLSAEWISALIEKPALEAFRKPILPAQIATTPAGGVFSPSRAKSQRAYTTPQAFRIRVVGATGKQSLANLQRRFGRLTAQLKVGGPQQSLVFPIGPEGVAAALAALGEIAPGLFLERERVFLPHSGFARAATPWLSRVLGARSL